MCLALSVLIILLVTVLPSHTCYGWNIDGHMAIGQTAMSAMRGNAVSQVKRLTRGKDVVDVAGWADKVRAKYPTTEPLHFQMQSASDSTPCTTITLDNCKEGLCLVNALTHFYGRVTSQNLKEMNYPEGIITLTDADALKYLINLIGDLHQPMHLANLDDNAGRSTWVKHSTDMHTVANVTLYSLWENDMIQKYRTMNAKFWDGGWTHVNSIGKSFFQQEKTKWDALAQDQKHRAFLAWAGDSRRIFCESIQNVPLRNVALTNSTEIYPALEHVWMEEIKRKILQAGVRVAIVLNSILEQREASKLRQGSGIDLNENKKGEKLPPWIRNLGTNVLVFLIVMVLFMYITKFYAGPSIMSDHKSIPKVSKPASPGRGGGIRMKEMTD